MLNRQVYLPSNTTFVSPFESMREIKVQVEYEYWFTTDYERNFDYYDKRRWLKNHLYIPYIIAAIYLISIYLGLRWMKNRPAFQFQRPLIVWNVSLATFSIIGALRTVPWFVRFLRTNGWHASCCVEPNINGVFGFYVWAFIVSKVPELGDTYFIIARKQKLIFLHWFHHISVLFFVWYGNSEKISIGPWFVVMNYPIHSLMYIHFSLKTLKLRVPSAIPVAITTLQIGQMLAGTVITLYAYSQSGALATLPCDTHDTTLRISLLLYGSYLLLFVNFFTIRYLNGLSYRAIKTNSSDK